MYDVVSFGSVVLDVTIRSSEFRVMKGHQIAGGVGLCQVYGGKTEVDGINVDVGGGGTNSAVSFIKKGLKAGAVVKLGDDEIGGMIKRALEKYNLGSELMVEEKGGESALSVILVDKEGGRSILTYRGVSKELLSREIDWEKVKGSKWFYVSSLGGKMSLLEDIVAFANKQEIKVAFNPGKAELKDKSRLERVLGKIDVLLLNRLELAGLLGASFDDDVELMKGASRLASRGLVVMTEGKKGSVAFDGEVRVRAGAYRVKSVDDTGAGDAFGSGFVYGRIKGWSLADSLKAGAANGASEVMRIGVKEGLLSESELAKWMKKELRLVEEKVEI